MIPLCVDKGGGQVDVAVAVEQMPANSAASIRGADRCCLCSLRQGQRVQEGSSHVGNIS